MAGLYDQIVYIQTLPGTIFLKTQELSLCYIKMDQFGFHYTRQPTFSRSISRWFSFSFCNMLGSCFRNRWEYQTFPETFHTADLWYCWLLIDFRFLNERSLGTLVLEVAMVWILTSKYTIYQTKLGKCMQNFWTNSVALHLFPDWKDLSSMQYIGEIDVKGELQGDQSLVFQKNLASLLK